MGTRPRLRHNIRSWVKNTTKRGLWLFSQMTSGFNMRLVTQGLVQWRQIYCQFLPIPPPYPVDVCGVGQWAATIRESWGGSGILGHGFLSATAGSRGRACWTGWGLGEFIDNRTLVWEGSVRRVFRKKAVGAQVGVREYRCIGDQSGQERQERETEGLTHCSQTETIE